MLYLCDNCGEIVLDKLLILQLQKHFPHLQITVMVRGGEVLNDATMRDVRQIHLDGCGLPIYYLLLCKCDYFCEQFRMHHLKGIFAYEKTLEISSAK